MSSTPLPILLPVILAPRGPTAVVFRNGRALAVVLPFLLACGGAPARPTPPSRIVELEETRIVARTRPDGEIEVDSYDASELFRRAYELGVAGRCAEAVPLYDRVVREFPGTRHTSAALYNAALCLQQMGDPSGAVDRWATLLERDPEGADAKPARFQMTEALIELERWEPALRSAEALIARQDLRSDERLEAMARRAQALFGLGRIDDAERAAREALTYYRTRQGADAIADPSFAAAANFVLAETIRTRSEALSLPDADVARQREVLERRAELLLEAQRAYFDTIRLTDARWAAAAGYRIGSMYRNLFRALTEAPVPPPSRELAPEAIDLYRREYRSQLAERVRPLIRHAIRYWELTLLMVERTGVESAARHWVDRTRAELEEARRLLLGTTGQAASPTRNEDARHLGSPAVPPRVTSAGEAPP